MALGQRHRKRVLGGMTGLLVVGVVIAWWQWPNEDEGGSDTLTAVHQPENGGPALRRIVQPDGPAVPDEGRGPGGPISEPGGASPKTPEPPPATAPATPATRPAAPADPAQAINDLAAGRAARERDELVTARDLLNRALHGGLVPQQVRAVRKELAELADRTLLSTAVVRNDPLVGYHVVQKGDRLGKIARKYRVSEDLLEEINRNRIADKNLIREGQRLKVIRGPFHATISKGDHLLHVYLQDRYVRTFRVALGANGGTPTGKWRVGAKLANPSWVDPRTGTRWHADDPQNPIGEFWISLEGLEGEATGQFGYGIHGTIEPETIGQDVSLGCVRLAADDVERVFRMLITGSSIVTISEAS